MCIRTHIFSHSWAFQSHVFVCQTSPPVHLLSPLNKRRIIEQMNVWTQHESVLWEGSLLSRTIRRCVVFCDEVSRVTSFWKRQYFGVFQVNLNFNKAVDQLSCEFLQLQWIIFVVFLRYCDDNRVFRRFFTGWPTLKRTTALCQWADSLVD